MPPTSPSPEAAVAAQRKFSRRTCLAHSLGFWAREALWQPRQLISILPETLQRESGVISESAGSATLPPGKWRPKRRVKSQFERPRAAGFHIAFPGPVGQGDLRSGPLVEEDPGFARPAGRHVRGGVEMPAALDHVVVVAGGAGEAGRERQGGRFGGDDELVGLVPQRNLVDRETRLPAHLVWSTANARPGQMRREARIEKMGPPVFHGRHALKSAGRNWMGIFVRTASLTRMTATALS